MTSVAEETGGAVHAPPAGEQLVRFEELFAAHHERVLAYLLRRVTNSGDVDDLVAETFLTAWRRLGDVPGGEGALPWLYAVARRVLANHRRREQTRLALVDKLRTAPVHTGHPDPEGAALTAAAWRELPERDREVLALIAWEGLEADQVAVVLGCSRNAVRIRLHRAKRRFEKLLRSTPALPEGGAA